jgi:hypothetical protein
MYENLNVLNDINENLDVLNDINENLDVLNFEETNRSVQCEYTIISVCFMT